MAPNRPFLQTANIWFCCCLLSYGTSSLATDGRPSQLSMDFEPVRTWTNVFGKTCDADLVEFFGATATLQTDLDTFVVPLASLSDEDLAYVQSTLEKMGRADWYPGRVLPTDSSQLRLDVADWKSQLEQWRQLLSEADSHTAISAWNQIRSIRDPNVLPVLSNAISETDDPSLAIACVEAIGAIETEAATTKLVELTLEDPRFPVSTSASLALRQRRASMDVFKAYANYLKSGKHRDRALVSITMTKIADGKRANYRANPEFTRALISILTIKQPQRIPVVQWTTRDTGWRGSPDGGGASRSKAMHSKWGMAVRFFDVPHPTALDLLRKYTGQDFGYNRRDWSRWLRESAEHDAE